MKHDWILNEDGSVDNWQHDYGHHNGPRCARCHESFCEHCDQTCYDEECQGVG